MQRVSRLLVLLLALSLFGAACSSGEPEPLAIDTNDAISDPAPEELASVDLSDVDNDDAAEDAAEDAGTELNVDLVDAMSDDTGDAGEASAPAPVTAGHDGNAIDLNTDFTGAGVAVLLDEETDACVTDALDSEPELRTIWASILSGQNAAELSEEDQGSAISPILECVSFGQVVAAVISNDSDVTLSDDSISCIDEALEGNEDLLVKLISDESSSDVDNTLVAAMVQCVSVDELNALMQG